MTEKSFVTTLTNDTKKSLEVMEQDGSILVVLEPGQSFNVESRNPRTMYARWSHVTWKRDGSVSFLMRTDWREPDRGRWVLTCLNQDGEAKEFRQIGEERICLPKGIPVIVTCLLTSDLVMFRSLTIVSKKILTKSGGHYGYGASRWVLIDDRMPRPDSELKALAKIIDVVGKK